MGCLKNRRTTAGIFCVLRKYVRRSVSISRRWRHRRHYSDGDRRSHKERHVGTAPSAIPHLIPKSGPDTSPGSHIPDGRVGRSKADVYCAGKLVQPSCFWFVPTERIYSKVLFRVLAFVGGFSTDFQKSFSTRRPIRRNALPRGFSRASRKGRICDNATCLSRGSGSPSMRMPSLTVRERLLV